MCRACHNRAGTLLRKSAAVSFLAASVSFAACVSGDMDAPEGAVYVRLELAMKDGVTRSSLGLDEDRVSDIPEDACVRRYIRMIPMPVSVSN